MVHSDDVLSISLANSSKGKDIQISAYVTIFFGGLGILAGAAILRYTILGREWPDVGYFFLILGNLLIVFACIRLYFTGSLTLNRTAGYAEERAPGLLGVFRKKTKTSIPRADEITLRREIEQRKHTHKGRTSYYPAIIYTVRAQCQKEESLLFKSDNYHPARKVAEKLANFFRVPVIDSGTGIRRVRAHDQLDESFRERILREGIDVQQFCDTTWRELYGQFDQTAEMLNTPVTPSFSGIDDDKGSRLAVSHEGDTVTYTIPAYGVTSKHIVGMFGIITGAMAISFFAGLPSRNISLLENLVIIPIVAIPLGLFIGISGYWHEMFGTQKVSLSSKELVVRSSFGTKTFDLDKLEDLQLSTKLFDPKGFRSSSSRARILAICDNESATFGDSLIHNDLERLYREICEKIVADAKTSSQY